MRAMRSVGKLSDEPGDMPEPDHNACHDGADAMGMRPTKFVMHSWVDYVHL